MKPWYTSGWLQVLVERSGTMADRMTTLVSPGNPGRRVSERAGTIGEANFNKSNSPSSSVAPHPEIQHMVPSSNSSPWLGRQMGSTNPEEEEEEDNQPNSAHFPRKSLTVDWK